MPNTLNLEDRLVLASMLATFAGLVFAAVIEDPSVIGFTALAVITALILGWRSTASLRLGWLLLFGLVAGVLELWADWLHVERLGSLVYTHDFGFRLLASPSYMPVGWWLTTVQFGYVALRLSHHLPRWEAVAVVSVLGMCLPPWYEELAAPARAWHYTTRGPDVVEHAAVGGPHIRRMHVLDRDDSSGGISATGLGAGRAGRIVCSGRHSVLGRGLVLGARVKRRSA